MPLGQTATHCYDSDNRLRKSRYSDGRIETFSYDAVGKDHPVLLVDWRAGVPFTDNYGGAYNADCLGRVVKKHLKPTGIDVPGGAHLLRHAGLRVTEVYVRVSMEKLREVKINRAAHLIKVKNKG